MAVRLKDFSRDTSDNKKDGLHEPSYLVEKPTFNKGTLLSHTKRPLKSKFSLSQTPAMSKF